MTWEQIIDCYAYLGCPKRGPWLRLIGCPLDRVEQDLLRDLRNAGLL
jgi:hypothetical protein